MLNDVDPVAFAVISVILTVVGVQETFEFHEPAAAAVIEGETTLKAIAPKGSTRIVRIRTVLTDKIDHK